MILYSGTRYWIATSINNGPLYIKKLLLPKSCLDLLTDKIEVWNPNVYVIIEEIKESECEKITILHITEYQNRKRE